MNGLGTTINTLVQCIGCSFISMILELFNKADQYVNGLYTSMGIVLFCTVVNILQTIYFFLLKPRCGKTSPAAYETISDESKTESVALVVDSEKAENGEAQIEETGLSEQKKDELVGDLKE